MAGLAAVNQVGESVVALLRARRNLLAAEGRLGPVPASFDITHMSLSNLANQNEPASGLTVTCYRIALSDHPVQRTASRESARAATLAVELHYLIAAWPAAAADEQAILTWAMLELSAHPVFDRSVLLGTGVWERDETVQIVPESLPEDALFRIWDALQRKLRLSAAFRARVVRIGYGPSAEWPPVVASRFGFADTGALETEPAS